VLLRVWGVGCGVWGVGCGVWVVGCGVWGVGCGVWGVGCGGQETYRCVDQARLRVEKVLWALGVAQNLHQTHNSARI